MDLVYLKKDGLYYGKEKIDNESISIYLNYTVNIEGDVTLENLFEILMSYNIDEMNFLFNPWTRGHRIEKYYEAMQEDSTRDKDNDLVYLEASWATDYFTYEDDDCVKQSEFSSYINISGISPEQAWGISLTPIRNLKDLLLRIDNKFEICEYGDGLNKIFESTKDITLNEFVGGILNEISFHGYPDDVSAFAESLKETSDMIDSGEMEMIPGEEVMLEMLENRLKYLVEEEKFEKAAKIKKEIEECKLKLKENEKK